SCALLVTPCSSFLLTVPPPPSSTPFPYTTLFRSLRIGTSYPIDSLNPYVGQSDYTYMAFEYIYPQLTQYNASLGIVPDFATSWRSEEHTSELQSLTNLVCRLLLEKKKNKDPQTSK